MRYDFDTPINRFSTGSLKWDVGENELPMWVADMDFHVAPEIVNAIGERTKHGIFGYSVIPDEWYKAYISWWETRHDFEINREHLIFTTGVVPAISSIVRKLTTPAEKVLIQTPVYNIFFNSIINNGRFVLESPLHYDGERYAIDFSELEKHLSDPQTSLMILCNPHNPTGTVWDKETLFRIGELCKKHNVTVVSDEIHCDLTEHSVSYTPFASVSDTCRDISVTCIAPTKAFNMAGLQTAAVMIPNDNLRHKVWRSLNTDEVAEPNVFAVCAAVAAFTKGAEWLDELREYVSHNKQTVRDFIASEIPSIKVTPSEATYLLWLDCSKMSVDTSEAVRIIREKTGLYLSEGAQFGGNGNKFIRINVACPKSVLMDGLKRLKAGVQGLF